MMMVCQACSTSRWRFRLDCVNAAAGEQRRSLPKPTPAEVEYEVSLPASVLAIDQPLLSTTTQRIEGCASVANARKRSRLKSLARSADCAVRATNEKAQSGEPRIQSVNGGYGEFRCCGSSTDCRSRNSMKWPPSKVACARFADAQKQDARGADDQCRFMWTTTTQRGKSENCFVIGVTGFSAW